MRGSVASVARGINVPNAQPNDVGLATVNPIFTWVRLAQRVPVRIQIDKVPQGVRLVAGMTATVQVEPLAAKRRKEEDEVAAKKIKEDEAPAKALAEAEMKGKAKEEQSLAANKPDADADLALFRAAYTSGDGLAYVVIKAAKDERICRYGNESRSASKKDAGAYTLYNCNERHVFVPQDRGNRTALLRATVVKFGEPGFLELDARYVSGCNNPDIRSAVPRN